MSEVDCADRLYAHILSNDFPAFQKTLSEIAEHASFMQKVLTYNAFDSEDNRYTLVQSATAHAIATGQTEMLIELINAGAETTWETGFPISPVLRRQNACAQDHAYSNEFSVVPTDSVDASFERALNAGNPYAQQIIYALVNVGGEQLLEDVSAIHGLSNLGFMTQIVYQYIGLNFTTLLQQTTLVDKAEAEAKAENKVSGVQIKR